MKGTLGALCACDCALGLLLLQLHYHQSPFAKEMMQWLSLQWTMLQWEAGLEEYSLAC